VQVPTPFESGGSLTLYLAKTPIEGVLSVESDRRGATLTGTAAAGREIVLTLVIQTET